MNICVKIAQRYLKRNRRRTTVTSIGIIIVIFLLSVLILLASVYQSYNVNLQRNNANWEVKFENIPYKNVYALTENSDIKEVAVTQGIGVSKDDYSSKQNDVETHIILKAYDELAMKNLGIELVKGRFPINNKEIVISSNFSYEELENINIDVNGKSENYTIVGIIQPPSFEKIGFKYCELGAITYLDKNLQDNELITAHIVYKNINDVYQCTEEIANVLNLYPNNNEKENIEYNEELLHYSNIWDMNNEDEIKILGTIIFIIVTIIIVAIIFLRSIFNLSIKDRKKEFANLNSIGATKKQIIFIVFCEATMLLIICIPIGLFLAILLVTLILNEVNDLLISSKVFLKIDLSYISLCVPIFLTGVTTYISLISPARKCNKLYIIEGLKGYNKKNNKKRNKKCKNIEKLLIYRNREANKEKSLSIIVFIGVSIFLAIFTECYITNNFKYDMNSKYNCIINIGERKYFEIVEEKIKWLKGVNNIVGYANDSYYITLENDKINSSLRQVMDLYPEIFSMSSKNEFECQAYALSIKSQENYLKKIGMTELKDGECILINYSPVEIKNFNGLYMTNYQEGDEITLYLQSKLSGIIETKENEWLESSTNIKEIGDEQQKVNIKISKVINEKQEVILNNNSSPKLCIIVNENTINDIIYQLLPGVEDKNEIRKRNFSLLVDTNNKKALEEALNQIRIENGIGEVYLNTNYIDINSNEEIVTKIFLYSLNVSAILIALTNIINILLNDVKVKNKEFSILSSIGMTRKQFNKIVLKEYVFCFITSFIIGTTLAIFINYLIFSLNIFNSYYYSFKLPFLALSVSFISLGLILLCITAYINYSSKKTNIVETIKNIDME